MNASIGERAAPTGSAAQLCTDLLDVIAGRLAGRLAEDGGIVFLDAVKYPKPKWHGDLVCLTARRPWAGERNEDCLPEKYADLFKLVRDYPATAGDLNAAAAAIRDHSRGGRCEYCIVV
jgi:hypothetical protein